LNFELLLTQN